MTAEGSAATSASKEDGNLQVPSGGSSQSMALTSRIESPTMKVSHRQRFEGSALPLCGLQPTDKTEIPGRDINHSMTHLTHRPLSSAEHPIIRLNAAGSYEASLSNGWRFNKWLLKVNLLWHTTTPQKRLREAEQAVMLKLAGREPKVAAAPSLDQRV